jgi:hypothetical protein
MARRLRRALLAYLVPEWACFSSEHENYRNAAHPPLPLKRQRLRVDDFEAVTSAKWSNELPHLSRP